jgi:hypothetical protein
VAIGEAIKPLETWQTEKILVPVGAIQLEDGVETIDTGAGAAVNLADYIGKDCKKKAATLKFARLEEWSNYSDPNCRQALITDIAMVCGYDSGFKAVCKGWEGDRLALVFACHPAWSAKENDNRESNL